MGSTHTSTFTPTGGGPGPVQQSSGVPDTSEPPSKELPRLSDDWQMRLRSVLWQLGYDPELVEQQLAAAGSVGLTEADVENVYRELCREVGLRRENDAYGQGSDIVTQWPQQNPEQYPGQYPPTKQPPTQEPPYQWPPDQVPPYVPPTPPNQGPVPVPEPKPDPGTPPSKPHQPPKKDPPGDGDGDHKGSLKPWLIGAGVLGTGAAGLLAFRSGARNVHALQGMRAQYVSGSMHQGGLQAINDAGLGARMRAGIGRSDYAKVATPIFNRFGETGKLTSVARGHLDHAEMTASAAALRKAGPNGAVAIHEPTRNAVLAGLHEGRGMNAILNSMQRNAGGAVATFDKKQMLKYWENTSILEHGRRGPSAVYGAQVNRPLLYLAPSTGGTGREIVTVPGRTIDIDHMVAGQGARLGDRDLANGIGTLQGGNIAAMEHPAMQANAIGMSGVDPKLVDELGLAGAFTKRWEDRIRLGQRPL